MTIPSSTDSANSNPYSVLNGDRASNSSGSSSSGSSSVDPNSAQGIQDRFLKLLTTQLQSQDPSNPMDNSQMTSQMAQISQVTGMEKLNSTMQTLLSSQMASQSLLAASTVGGQALVAGNTLVSDGAGKVSSGAVSLDGSANQLSIAVKNAAGTTVAAFSVANPQQGLNNFTWDGTDGKGNTLPAGAYTFSAEASNTGTTGAVSVGTTPYANRTIKAVSWDSTGAPQLLLSDGRRVGMSAVQQIS
jgi:flagellar basal-body rod modification protein FlgD